MQVLDEAGLLDNCDLSGLYATISRQDQYLKTMERQRTASGTFTPIYSDRLSDKVRSIRFPVDIESELAMMGDRAIQFIREAVKEKINRDLDA